MFSGRALVVVMDSFVSDWLQYSDCLTGICEPLSPPSRWHTNFEKKRKMSSMISA